MHHRIKIFFLPISLLCTLSISLWSCETRTPVWSEDIAPIVFKNCSVCHRPGEAAPFPLLTYRDAAKRARTIARMVSSRSMPPWPADPSYTHFLNERLLTQEEIDLIAAWAAAGAPEGDSTQTPPTPVFPPYTALGKPDLILQHPEPFFIPGDNRDHFVAMKFPFELPQNTWVRAIEFIPGNRQAVHHMNGHLISFDANRKQAVHEGFLHLEEGEFSVPALTHKKLGILHDDGSYPNMTPSVVNYLPGVFFLKYPDEIGGYHFPQKGALYVKNMHYGPSPKDTFDHSKFHIYFSKTPPGRPVQEMILGTLGVSPIEPPLVIPPGTIKKFITKFIVKEDISVLTLNPHMHLTGKRFKGYALGPERDTIRLIHIPDWDFRWQYFYTFPKMVKIPKGYTLVAEGEFDNTSKNPNNPFDPPREVREQNGSMRTTDEMFQFIISWLPYQKGDEEISLEGKSGK